MVTYVSKQTQPISMLLLDGKDLYIFQLMGIGEDRTGQDEMGGIVIRIKG